MNELDDKTFWINEKKTEIKKDWRQREGKRTDKLEEKRQEKKREGNKGQNERSEERGEERESRWKAIHWYNTVGRISWYSEIVQNGQRCALVPKQMSSKTTEIY